MAKDTTKKKHHVVLWIILILVFILIVLPIVFVYGFFYDGKVSSYQSKYETKIDFNDLIQKKMIDSMDDTKDNGTINLQITEDDINEVLLTVQEQLKKDNDLVNKYVTGLRIDINDKEYVFSVSAKVPMFKTRVFLYCTLDEVKSEDTFEFKINSIKIARAGFLSNLVFSLLNKYVSDSTLNQAFNSANLNLKSDLANRRITYAKKDIVTDLNNIIDKNLTSVENNYKALAKSVIQTISDNELLNVDFNKNKALNLAANLNKMHDNTIYTIDRKGIDTDNLALISNLKKLMDESKFEITQKNVNNVASYLIYGYNNVKEESQQFVEDKDFSTIGITNIKSYTGLRNPDTYIDMNETISNQFPNKDTLKTYYEEYLQDSSKKTRKIASFTELNFTNFLINTNLFGYSSIFYYKTSDNTYKIAYMMIDNCYVDIVNNGLSLVFELNINGYKTVLILDLTASSLNNFKMELNINKFFIGEIEDKDGSLKKAVCDTLEECLTNANSGWISFDTTNNTLTFDMAKSIDSSSLFKQFSSDYFTGALIGKDIKDKGEFELYFDISKIDPSLFIS